MILQKAKKLHYLCIAEGGFIQHIAGASGLGLFNAAKEVDKYAIGVGKSQSYIEPDYIIATSAGNIHVIVYDEIKALLDGNWQAGVHNWGIKENAVGFTMKIQTL